VQYIFQSRYSRIYTKIVQEACSSSANPRSRCKVLSIHSAGLRWVLLMLQH